MWRSSVSRHKTTIQIVLVAAALLLAVGTPAQARGVAGRNQAQIVKNERFETAPLSSFWQWVKVTLKRYAMAAN